MYEGVDGGRRNRMGTACTMCTCIQVNIRMQPPCAVSRTDLDPLTPLGCKYAKIAPRRGRGLPVFSQASSVRFPSLHFADLRALWPSCNSPLGGQWQ